MDPKFIVNLQGRDHPVYAGVLAEAHERGLLSIETTLIQIPAEENNHTAILKAKVTMKDGSFFEGYGDANAKNVNPRIATAILRMAETRAKGRALRDAINCGQTMLEEMPDLEADAPRPQPARARTADVLEKNERPIPVDQPGTAEGFEERYVDGQTTFRRKDLVAYAMTALEAALAQGIKVEPITPHQTTNAELVAWGRAVRPLLAKKSTKPAEEVAA